MTETEKLLARQSRWQKERKALSWPEKIRMAEQVRSSAQGLRAKPPLKNPAGRR